MTNVRSFPQYMQSVYTSVHQWLDTLEETIDFRGEPVELDYTNIREVGTHYHKFFPAHYFKVAEILGERETLSNIGCWLRADSRICVVDIGCGSGAASCAFIETLSNLIESGALKDPVHLHLIGIDPEQAAMLLYRATLDRIKRHPDLPRGLTITHEFLSDKMPCATGRLVHMLRGRRQAWSQPCLPHTILLQVNTVRVYQEQNVVPDVACALVELLTKVSMDRLSVFTIATKDKIGALQATHCELVSAMSAHKVAHEVCQDKHTTYQNPPGSFFDCDDNSPYTSTFHASIVNIECAELRKDSTWHQVMAKENLELAWARARTGLLRESLVDETEIRLIDSNVSNYIQELQRRLGSYSEEIFHPEDEVNYDFPKNAASHRPKSLARLDEEILSVAIIQVAGAQLSSNRSSYAFRLNTANANRSEYLYQYYLKGYKEWLENALEAARSCPHGFVLRTDIAAFYTNICQDILAHAVYAQMPSRSGRVKWLIEKLLKKYLDPSIHKPGHGLAQGGVGSGFFANVYLSPIDEYFKSCNPSGAKYFRYADDIIIVVQNREALKSVKGKLEKRLRSLALCLSKQKTKCFTSAEFDSKYSEGSGSRLDDLGTANNQLFKRLWLALCVYSKELDVAPQDLYQLFEMYRECLCELEIYVDIPMIRRKWVQYKSTATDGSFSRQLPDFDLACNPAIWAVAFAESEHTWVKQRNSLRSALREIIRISLPVVQGTSEEEKRHVLTELRFSVNRLCRLGMPDDVAEMVADWLKDSPHEMGNLGFVLESLAIQGYERIVLELYNHYTCANEQKYLSAMALRAMRFLSNPHRELLMTTSLSAAIPIESRLMASESLLVSEGTDLSYQDWTAVNNVLSNEALPPRLRKNLILLLKQARDPDPQSFEPLMGDDRILFRAFEENDVDNVSLRAEPVELSDFVGIHDPDDAYEYGELMTHASH